MQPVIYPEQWHLKTDHTARYFRIPPGDFTKEIARVATSGADLIAIFGVEEFHDEPFSLVYLFEDGQAELLTLVCSTNSPESVTPWFPVASLFEREITDGFGVRFTGAFDTRRLFLHEWYPASFHPLKKDTPSGPVIPEQNPVPYPFREVSGSSVYQIPVGPVHAGIIEPGHFRFSVIGEEILNLEIRLGYLHRGIEKLAKGMTPETGLIVAESIAGDESASNACGYAMAAEQIAGAGIPKRATALRGIILELERSYALLSDLAGMATDVAFSTGASRLLMLRERLMRECDAISGSRFLKGIISIGGITREIDDAILVHLKKTVEEVGTELPGLFRWLYTVPSIHDRFATTGIIRPDLIRPLALSGPVARASGSYTDTRTDHPYGVYLFRQPDGIRETKGDVLARFLVKSEEVAASLRFISDLISELPDGPVSTDVTIPDGYALSLIESPRGMNIHWLLISNGRISRYKVRTASFCNWQAIEHAVMGNIVPDFPVINKSMNLSYTGRDL